MRFDGHVESGLWQGAQMPWWGWVLVVLALLAAFLGAFLAVQARRRRGGVIARERR